MYRSLLLYSTILFSNTALAEITPNQCGMLFDAVKGCIDTTTHLYKCTTQKQNKTIFKHSCVENYQDIFSNIHISFNAKFLYNHIAKKILNDLYVNNYTLTYLVYQEEILFNTSVASKHISNANSYISNVKTGGQHIVLYHIPCKSKRTYANIKKKLKNNNNWQDVKKYLIKLSKDHEIIVKDIHNKESSLIPTNNIENSFNAIANYHLNIKQDAKPYAYEVANNHTIDNKTIVNIFNLYDKLNNLRYYKQHRNYFHIIPKYEQIKLFNMYQKINTTLNRFNQNQHFIHRQNLTSFAYTLPPLYTSFIAKDIVNLAQKSISMTIEINKTDLKIINPKRQFSILLQTKLDIKNKGQLLRMTNQIIFKSEKQNYKHKKIEIIKDTYVDYPGLRFNAIDINYGTLSLNIAFDKYGQFHEVNGTGILKNAICGYDINKDNLSISCKDIKYRSIKINFKHKEGK